MESCEIFANLATIPPIFVRLDGRAFHRLTQKFGFLKPYDNRFCKAMVEVSKDLVAQSGLSPVFAFTFSDEISLFFNDLPFSGRVEKIDSVAASFAASALTLALSSAEPLSFDARIVQTNTESAVEYMINRQHEAWRNHLNAYCQHALIEEGMDANSAAAYLKGKPAQDLHELMHKRGVNLAKTPAWQRRGILIMKKEIEKDGFNPVTQEHVTVTRNKVAVNCDLPLLSTPEGQEFIRSLISGKR